MIRYLALFFILIADSVYAEDCEQNIFLAQWEQAVEICGKDKDSNALHSSHYGLALIYSEIGVERLQEASLKGPSHLSSTNIAILERAMKSIEVGVEAGVPEAQYTYALFLNLIKIGEISINEIRASEEALLKAAADQGLLDAAFMYGMRGVLWLGAQSYEIKDPDKYAYLRLAAENYHPKVLEIFNLVERGN